MYRWKNMAFASTLLSIAIISFIQFFFLTFYIYFPPNTDEYISWLGRQISQPANIFLVDHQPTDRSPLDENLLKLTQHRVSLVTRSDLEANPGQMKTWKNFVAFIESKDDREYAEWIAQEIPGANVQAAYSPGKRLRGYVVTDMQINASMDISISHGLRGLWNSPTRNILLFCGLGIVILFLRQKAINGQTSNKMSELP
jgi:hypothetical protein